MNKKILSLVTLCVIFLAGCGRQYQIKPLKHVKREEAHFVEQKDGVELRIQQLNQKELADIFNGKYIANKRIIPLLVTLKNNITIPIILDKANLDIPLLSEKVLYTTFSRTSFPHLLAGMCALPLTLPLGVGTGAAAIVVADACGFFAECNSFAAGLLVFSTGFLVGAGIGTAAIIGATGYGIHNNSIFNKAFKLDLQSKMLTKLIVAPSKEESTLLFTKDQPEKFTITLLKGQEKVPFTVTLKNLETPKVK